MTIPPLAFVWDGEAMWPKRAWLADRHYVIGEDYTLVPHEERSMASHSHYFAALHDAWSNLRDEDAARFPNADALRKYALIKAGYRDERSIVCASKAEAQRMAAFVKPMDDYALVVASEAVVTVYTAKSQSMKAMGKETFQASKDAVLGVVAEMLGVEPDQLSSAREHA